MEEKNEVIEETMNDVEVIDLYPEEDGDDSGSHGLGKLVIGVGLLAVGGLAVAGAGLAALAVKNKDKIKEKRLAKMKKKLLEAGYEVEDPAVITEDYEEDFLEEEVETNEESEN